MYSNVAMQGTTLSFQLTIKIFDDSEHIPCAHCALLLIIGSVSGDSSGIHISCH
jgi:hypothetical protein